jgi:hypothetical protein
LGARTAYDQARGKQSIWVPFDPEGAARQTPPASTNGKAKAERVEPVYLEDGTPMCPTHGKELKEGKWGLFCSAKDKDTGEYCKLKFAE